MQFEIDSEAFLVDGKRTQIISGALHYFRVMPEYWEDRLRKMKACGLNTVETYVPWNAHEPKPGQFDFTGMLDIVRFVKLAGELGFLVIVRPSPYICAEWDFGGLPAWLLADPGMKLRCMHPAFLQAVDRYFDHLLPLLAPLQCTQNGPIVAMQIENEYGSYGNDTAYLSYLEDGMKKRGIDVSLFTSDGPSDSMLQGGTLPHIHKTANFGSRSKEAFGKLREYQPDGPLMCAEFWNGWFDHWGKPHHTRDAADAAKSLDEMLSVGASVNFYMFHGGTNFGYTSGANYNKETGYEPTVTSYDYDAPLNESGDPTPKFFAFQEVIAKYHELPGDPLPAPIPKSAFGKVALTEQVFVIENVATLAEVVRTPCPEPMEALGQNNGFILYRTRITGPRVEETLNIQDVRDRALIYQDGVYLGTYYRNDPATATLKLTVPAEGATLDILVENMGHINYGPWMIDRKGITEGVRLGIQFQYHWETYCLPFDTPPQIAYTPTKATDKPAFYRGTFELTTPADTFVAIDTTSGWTKGLCYINGFNLGRYWADHEPHRNMYLPAPLLKAGTNEIVVLELHGNANEAPSIELVEKP